jgi:hypothetical protein
MLLSYHIIRSDKKRNTEAEDAFKGQLLASNWNLYDQLYGESSYDRIETEMNEKDFYHPESESDLKKLIAEFNSSMPKDKADES